jgi:hypothetical protein
VHVDQGSAAAQIAGGTYSVTFLWRRKDLERSPARFIGSFRLFADSSIRILALSAACEAAVGIDEDGFAIRRKSASLPGGP